MAKEHATMTGPKVDDLSVAGQAISLRSLVADRLRQAIVTGRFPPGSQLRERELCELTGVSRPSLREAFRILEAEGLIATAPHRGPVVTAMTVDEVGHLYALRRLLETFAAREFARRRRPEDLVALKRAVKRLDEIEATGSPFELLEAGTTYYSAIATGSGNPYLAQALGTLHNRIKLIRFISLQKEGRAQGIESLRILSDAIVAGDEEGAERIVTEHLDRVAVLARAIVESGYALPTEPAVAI
ncbi:DNA-binding GntR family transcriptional regulator [Bradyrhizobium sp. GM2.4]